MSKSLSIELRPKTFDEVIGHRSVVDAIKRKLSAGVVGNYLFSGPYGTGKTTLARIVARAVQGDDFKGDPEIVEINASDTNGVDDIRELVRTTDYFPASGRYKVIILDEAHKLTEPAQNVLLKPFEAKDGATAWIICTTSPDKIIPALRSRCLCFPLKGMSTDQRNDLLDRADEYFDIPLNNDQLSKLRNALAEADITSPRDILMAYDKFRETQDTVSALAGLGQDFEPQYADVAKAVMQGNWEKTAALLSKLKTSDTRGLRSVVGAFMGNDLLQSSGARADALSNGLRGLAQYNTFEDGLTKGATIAVLYEVCKKLGGK